MIIMWCQVTLAPGLECVHEIAVSLWDNVEIAFPHLNQGSTNVRYYFNTDTEKAVYRTAIFGKSVPLPTPALNLFDELRDHSISVRIQHSIPTPLLRYFILKLTL